MRHNVQHKSTGTGVTLAIFIYELQLMPLLGITTDETSLTSASYTCDYKLCTLWTPYMWGDPKKTGLASGSSS